MKLPIVFLAVLGLVCGKSLPTRNLQDDLNDFLALVPLDKVLEISLDYLANDQEVQDAVIYLQSPEFHKILTTVEDLKEFKDFLKFVNDLGVDVYSIINTIHDVLGLPPFQPKHSVRKGVGLNGLIDDVIKVLPVEDLKALFYKKLQTSPEFQALIAGIQSPEFKNILDTLRAIPEYQDLLQSLRDKGVDVDHIIELLKALFGLSRKGKSLPTGTLQDDLNDFLALVPIDKVLEISLDYLANDQEVQEAVAYLQSEEFYMILTTVEDLKEFKDFVEFMNDLGVDVYALDNQIHDILGLPPFQPKQSTRRGVGLNGLIEDVINVLPVDEFKALFDEKMQTSPEFQALIVGIQSPEFVNIVDTLRATPEYQDLLQHLQDKGFDVDHFNELFRALFGLSRRGAPTLQDDLNNFLALVPMDKVLKIVLDYLSNDKEVREFVVHIQSEEFPKIHTIVEHLKEYKNCSKFNNDHAVDVYVFINKIHNFLGLPPFQPTNARRMGVGIYGLIEDVIAVLPLHDLKGLFEVKMETREYFKALVTCMRSPVFMKMVDTVRSWPEYYELLEIIREKVVDVDRIIELFRKLYWRGTHILKEDLKEFMVLVPTYEVIHLTLDYLHHDTELHELSAYIQSEEFPKIHAIVEYLKEYKDCLKFITDYGVDIYAFILEVYDILGLPPLPPTNITHMGVGVYGLVEDVIALLPLQDVKILFDVKMKTREYFQTVVTTIHSPAFLDMMDTVQALPEYKKLLEILREHVVDLDLIIKHLRELWELFVLPPFRKGD